jgi:two-component system response regulator
MTTDLALLRTLIVDDAQEECVLLHAQLRSLGSVKVIGFVHDGLEAIAYLRGIHSFKDRETFPYPDLVLLDFRMPRWGGMEVLRFLRHRIDRPRVILWSNTPEQINVGLARHLGADVVCAKPANRAQLAAIIEQVQSNAFEVVAKVPQATVAREIHAHATT